MKHSQQVLIIFMTLFLVSQIIGLLLVAMGSEVVIHVDEETHEESTEVIFFDTTVGERPDLEGEQTIFAIILGVLFGTIILLFLARFNKVNIWKHWFFFAAVITMSISFGVLTNNALLAWLMAVFLGAWKIYRSNFVIHNLTELFIYPGIALLLVPLLNLFYGFVLLFIISVYDAYAVWKSKHMVSMAKFAKKANLFPGLTLAYNEKTGSVLKQKYSLKKSLKETKSKKAKKTKVRTGILGGGDIAFPMIFASVFLVYLLERGYSQSVALGYSFIISFFAALSLLLLFVYGKKDRYYPAMPFISAGCFFGYFVALFLIYIL